MRAAYRAAAAALLALSGLLLPSLSHAQVPIGQVCLPVSNWGPTNQSGGKLMEGRDNTIKGDWYALWCPKPGGGWTLKTHAVLDKYKTLSPTLVFQLGMQIWSSSTPAADLQAMITSNQVIPPAGTQDRYDLEVLWLAACTQGTRVLPAPNQVLTGACVQPTPIPPPPVPTIVYEVSSTLAYAVKPDGTRDTKLYPVPATLRSTCDCTPETGKKIVNPFGGQWCKVTIPGATVMVVAGCSVKK